ncbi:Hypothetical protein GLP15_127 [Giardia lamblia P15]|uniref:RRM Nup35-type domain-containing protein n=1 Tax=Giardia intestinalis (strain P15) TaxID=658858 RepID=E1EWZ5_GIAIA|nr:Hypothetical protein GLP15_127 [Giardia lamblia P15]
MSKHSRKSSLSPILKSNMQTHSVGFSYQNDPYSLSSRTLATRAVAATDIPGQHRKIAVPEPIDLASVDEWVTVYGITPSNLSLALHALMNFGIIMRVNYANHHFIHVRFGDALSAQAAVSARVICLSKVSIIGIIPCLVRDLDNDITLCHELDLPPYVLTKKTPPVVSNGILERIINWFATLLKSD